MSQNNHDLGTRMAPHSLEAEEAVLGSILIDPETLYQVLFLTASDFFLVKHQWTWEAVIALNERRAPIDYLTICEELDRRGQLAEIGGQAYISHLIGVVPTAIHAEGYARIIEQASVRRKILAAASSIAQMAYEESEGALEQLGKAQQLLFDIGSRSDGNAPQPLHTLVADYYSQVEQRYEHRGETRGIPTGFVDLDGMLDGLQKTHLVVIAARPSVGKTSLLFNIALNASRTFHQHVAIFSLEMSSQQVVERLVAQESDIDSHKLRTGELAEDDWPRFIEASEHLSTNGRMWIDDTPLLSPMQLRGKARRLLAQHGIDLVVVDYLQRLRPDGRHDNRVQEVSYLARSLKSLARELDRPILVAAQLSRAVEQRQDKRPYLSDLRESGDIENEADVVAFLYPDPDATSDPAQPHIPYEIIVAKHRTGPTGTVPLLFQKSLTRFASGVRREIQL